MKRNNKALYEKIMRNVSKEVKCSLNESEDSIQDELDFIFEGLYDMLQQSGIGRNSGDFVYGAETMAREICENADFICGCSPEIIGTVIQKIVRSHC